MIVATPDGAIASVAERVSKHLPLPRAIVHCAGAHGVGPLLSCARVGVAVGVMHPLVSFASSKRTPALNGTTFVIAGDKRATALARRAAAAVGAHVLIVDRKALGPCYHAAAALCANGSVALTTFAVDLLEGLGIARRDAERALGGLLRSVADNVERLGVPAALTGPIARGDFSTVAAHRAALRSVPAVLNAYDRITPLIVAAAKRTTKPPRRKPR